MSWLFELLDVLTPVLVGVGVGFSMQVLKEMFAWLDTQGEWVKRAVVLTLSFLYTKLAGWAGVVAGVDITTITPEAMDTLLSAVLATALHNAKQVKAMKATLASPPEG